MWYLLQVFFYGPDLEGEHRFDCLCKEQKGTIMATDRRVRITLACSECKQRNYNTMKNKTNDPDRLEMNKYCRFCRKHTLNKETK